MGIAERTKQNKNGILYPNDVRQILETDNDEIKRLCKQVKVYPKKDHLTGKTFFMKDDVEFLKRIKELHERGQKLLDNKDHRLQSPVENPINKVPSAILDGSALIKEFQNALEKVISNQNNMVEKIQTSLDDKLEGMDEVVVELIQCKTENENLRMKLNQLTKENYDLRGEIELFRPVGFGLYTKNKNNSLGF